MPDDVVAAPEADVRRLGLSRTECVRGETAQYADLSDSAVGVGQGRAVGVPDLAIGIHAQASSEAPTAPQQYRSVVTVELPASLSGMQKLRA